VCVKISKIYIIYRSTWKLSFCYPWTLNCVRFVFLTYFSFSVLAEAVDLTDDTQMTQELAAWLIENKGEDLVDLSKRFTERYFKDGAGANYGNNVVHVFAQLQDTNYEDPLQPAKKQFGGLGSFGNGAAMRIAPVPLFTFPDIEKTTSLASKQATITHANEMAQHGAVFLALAIRRSLLSESIDTDTFLDNLKMDLEEFGACEEFLNKISVIREFVNLEEIKIADVIEKLGNGVAARRSVPTAVFCFLRCLRPISLVAEENAFRRAVELAILLGGDTDTIGSMAGAVAGAYHGLLEINENIVKSCPDHELAVHQADELYRINQATK